ncbi:hypothetical protein M885DRAFT_590572 [Pelagophyceae sp. CCMP2097]|nr:hypothetical protein M885DRAFT_590572 [Pelagophyceae sp. CCMP2097]|mmetsp:Transcript_13830/g.46111  ORF Transcript_13830/g.46111 Transcript_13830/m.46111 type:complete len:280 (+) Transcript_13830:36-875(+)
MRACVLALLAALRVSAFVSPSGRRSVVVRSVPQEAPQKGGEGSQVISDFCISTNSFWKTLVLPGVLEKVAIRPQSNQTDFFDIITSPPESPGIPRPVWLTIAASVPTALGWYGYYKFSVEEELFQWELQTEGRVTGCGGYGTLLPFVFGFAVGGPLALCHIPPGETIVQAASIWILLGQVNLYRRVNECFPEAPPLHAWWALLPPPLDVVVGLRQVHFLSEFWREQRGDRSESDDVFAKTLFPFISSPRFTLKEFARSPKLWFWFTKDTEDFKLDILKD